MAVSKHISIISMMHKTPWFCLDNSFIKKDYLSKECLLFLRWSLRKCLTSLGNNEMKSLWNWGSMMDMICLTCDGSHRSMRSSRARIFSDWFQFCKRKTRIQCVMNTANENDSFLVKEIHCSFFMINNKCFFFFCIFFSFQEWFCTVTVDTFQTTDTGGAFQPVDHLWEAWGRTCTCLNNTMNVHVTRAFTSYGIPINTWMERSNVDLNTLLEDKIISN